MRFGINLKNNKFNQLYFSLASVKIVFDIIKIIFNKNDITNV